MKILSRLKDAYLLQKRVEELETALQSKDKVVRQLKEENASLQDRVKELVFKYRDIDSELAGMNYRIYELSQENKILTLKLVGARAERDGMQRWIEKIKEQDHDHGDT